MSDRITLRNKKTGQEREFTVAASKFLKKEWEPVEGEVKTASAPKKKDAEAAEAELEAARAKYEEVTGEKPGNRKLETLQAAINEAKSK